MTRKQAIFLVYHNNVGILINQVVTKCT